MASATVAVAAERQRSGGLPIQRSDTSWDKRVSAIQEGLKKE